MPPIAPKLHLICARSGYAEDTLTNDSNGNLTYDGTQMYTYDAWNRLKTVAHAWRDTGGVHSGQVFDTMIYDAKNRRIVKAINGTGLWDCTYNYYYDGDSMIEEQNGSGQLLKQMVWGATYIDELLALTQNRDPSNTNPSNYYTDFVLQDANWNVIGLWSAPWNCLDERYEYTPYGQRMPLYGNNGSDLLGYEPLINSWRDMYDTPGIAYGEFGFQGLMEDEESGLVYARNRYLSPTLGRWMQRDPMGTNYDDGLDPYEALDSDPSVLVDPDGSRPRLGGWSGIDSYGPTHHGNYVEDWFYDNGFDFDPTLSDQSQWTKYSLAFGTRHFARTSLNQEAQSSAGRLGAGSYCGASAKNIQVLMLSPATSGGNPDPKCNCCKIHATLVFDPQDDAVGTYTHIPTDIASRQRQVSGWGVAIPVELGGVDPIANHTPDGLGLLPIIGPVDPGSGVGPISPPRPTSGGRRLPGYRSFNPRQWIQDAQNSSADYTFVCHSEGCNMLLNALGEACKKK